MNKIKVLIITGATAIGKSEIAIEIAKRLGGEIVSADSMQVYKGMDVGTAKPSINDVREVPHHLIDIAAPDEEFSVAEYQQKARKEIADISNRGNLPILVGGSGLYIRAVIDRFEFPPGTLDSSIRKRLEEELQRLGAPALHERLRGLDPHAGASIHANNSRRVIRALEVIESTGHPFSEFQKEWRSRESIYDGKIVALNLPRKRLYAKIDERVDRMICDGLVEETKLLLSQGYGRTITSKQALGYRQVLDYLEEKIPLDECVSRIKQKTRHFAKRQITWLKHDPRVVWVDISGREPSETACEVVDFLRAVEFIT